ncbi:hypothetical protein V498_10500, partial [Pseudogymnoascus sp. VKM F-4517 (FW-2822)]
PAHHSAAPQGPGTAYRRRRLSRRSSAAGAWRLLSPASASLYECGETDSTVQHENCLGVSPPKGGRARFQVLAGWVGDGGEESERFEGSWGWARARVAD